jgi:hypothetical protein
MPIFGCYLWGAEHKRRFPSIPCHARPFRLRLWLPSSSDFDETSRRDRRGGVSAERRILPLHFSDGGFLPKAATLRNSRSVWTAVTSAPLFVRTEIIHLSRFSARSTAPLKSAHSKTLRAICESPANASRLGLRWQAQRDTALERPHATLPPTSHLPKAPSPLPLCRRTP